MATNPMRKLEERHTNQEVKFLVWCDRMDLLAVANIRGEVSLHRLNWQRVWCLSPPDVDVHVLGLAWRPDGKVIAIGYSDGSLHLIDVETKKSHHIQKYSSPISTISWLLSPDPNDSFKINDGSCDFISELPELSWDSTSPSNNIKADDNLVDPTMLNILLVGTSTGVIHLSLFGLFNCVVIDVAACINECCTILHAHMSACLKHLYATIRTHNKNKIKLVTLETSIFRGHATELHMLAYKYGKIISLLNYLEGTISSIEQAWESILFEMDSKLERYATSVPEGAVAAQFLDLLIFGFPANDLDIFLTEDLTEKGLRKLGHSIECSYSNIQKLVLKNLTKVAQDIMYYLIDVRGMSRWQFRYDVLGLSQELAGLAISAAGSFLIKGSEIQQVIDHSMRDYKAFFRWLYVVILRGNDEQVPPEIVKVSQQDIMFIGEFLKNFDALPKDSKQSKKSKYFSLERLGQYLVDAPLVIPLDVTYNPWNEFISSRPELAKSNIIIPHHQQSSLIQEHKLLVNAITELFGKPKIGMSETVKFVNELTLIKTEDEFRFAIKNFDPFLTYVAITNPTSPNLLYLLEFDSRSSDIRGGIFQFNPDNPYTIIDLQFYLTHTLSVLLHTATDPKQTVFAQVSITAAKPLLTNIRSPVNVLHQMREFSPISACDAPMVTGMKVLDSGVGCKFAVSGNRKVSVILMENLRSVCLYEMDVEEEDEDEGAASPGSEENESLGASDDIMSE